MLVGLFSNGKIHKLTTLKPKQWDLHLEEYSLEKVGGCYSNMLLRIPAKTAVKM